MNLSTKIYTLLTSSLGFLTFNFVLSLPASASITCEPGTINKYSNGSLAGCILAQDTTLQRYHPRSGTFTFSCKAQEYINFDPQGQFQSCRLVQEMEIRQGNAIEKCLAEYRVDVSENDNGLSVRCNRY
ncbi:MAG TPA: hypothetical protein VK203_30700 [Nostocaceae cyanobacterium]|nr:hypothetical protein [Nostocaceae cyanobacterium]